MGLPTFRVLPPALSPQLQTDSATFHSSQVPAGHVQLALRATTLWPLPSDLQPLPVLPPLLPLGLHRCYHSLCLEHPFSLAYFHCLASSRLLLEACLASSS